MIIKRLRLIVHDLNNYFKRFFHQLRLLLWKNFLIKKRSPLVLLFELTVPLVLFLIMFGIRKKQSAKPVDTQFFDAWPLPSAGFIPLMQGFCDKNTGYRNEDGFYEYPNSTAKDLLIQLDKLKKENYMNAKILNKLFSNEDKSKSYQNVSRMKHKIDSPEMDFINKSINELYKLNSYFPSNLCTSENISSTNSNSKNQNIHNLFSNINTLNSDNGTVYIKNELMKDSGFIGLWLSMQKTFCGSLSNSNQESSSSSSSTSNNNRLSMNDKQLQSIGLILHLIYSNPVILYTPNSTVTTQLIAKSNGTFELLEQISLFARVWLNKTNQIKSHFNKTNDLIDKIKIIDSMCCSWLHLMSGVNLNIFKGFRNENDLVDYFLNNAYNQNRTVFASIVFSNLNENSTRLPENVKYKIRQNASFTQSTKKIRDRYWFPSPRAYNYYYYIFGFVWIQDLLDRSIINTHSNNTVLEPGTYVHQMPYPCYLSDEFLEIIEHVMPLCLAISFVYTVSMLSQQIVYEKELRLKEVMKIMGLSNSAHWLAWFITYFIQFSLVMSFITLILHYGKILMHSNACIIFILLVLYAIATICFTFLISVLYTKAKLAAACAGIVYFLSYVPCMYISIREEVAVEVIPIWIKLIASLFSTSAFGLGAKYIAFYEYGGTGIQWSNIDKSPLEDDSFNCLIIVKCMIFDSFLYVLLAWYIEQVNPGFGLPRSWYFLFQKSFWFGEEVYQLDSAHTVSHKQMYLFESEPLNLEIGVKLCNLTKIFSNKKLAVDGLNYNFYENQITSFLGVNGAGKSTTMSIITGLMPATRGQVIINGRDLNKNLNEIRTSMGWCPQHNILFDKLTVQEHLWFYGQLKQIKAQEIEKTIEGMLTDIDLLKKQNSMVNTLSGGMKRKLSVAIAFVGNPSVCLLDEPTAGVDPYSRRAIWDLLIKYKQNRTIILSTHHMDEAELLGDRVAIISNGQLKCSGSSLFLKNVLGEGNTLTLVKSHPSSFDNKKSDDNDETLIDLDTNDRQANESDRLLTFIHRFVASAYLKMETLREYHFMIPLHERSNQKYWQLFNELEANKHQLNIDSYGIQDVSLEEIFLKVSEMDSEQEQAQRSIDPKRIENLNYIYSDLEQGWRLVLKQFCAILLKRYFYNKRNWKSLLTQIILPALFICVAMTVALTAPGFQDLPPLELSSSSQFYPLTKPIGTYVPFSYKPNKHTTDQTIASSSDLIDSLRMIVGLGPTCALNRQNLSISDLFNSSTNKLNLDYFGENGKCKEYFDDRLDVDWKKANHYSQEDASHDDLYPNCYCLNDHSGFRCEHEGTFRHPREFHTIAHETLLNVSSSRNESFYYLYTTDMYRLNRYGGLSFDHDGALSVDENEFDFIRKNKAKVWYNHKAFHAIPTYVNVMNNALLRANVKKSIFKNSESPSSNGYSITVINHPMNRTNNYLSTDYILQGSDVIISIFTIVAMSFVPASFVLFLVYERSIKALHLQFLIGLNPLLYWITNFLWDLFNYLLPASCVIIILRLFNVTAYVEQENFSAVIALFLMYGWSITPLMYPFSYLFSEPSNAYICLIVLNLFTGITCVVSSFLLQIFSIDDSSNSLSFLYEFAKKVFLVFPPYCLGRGLIDIAYNDYYNVFYTKTGQFDKVKSPFEWDTTLRNLVSMACIGTLSWLFTLLLEYDFFKVDVWLEYVRKFKRQNTFQYLIDSDCDTNDDDVDVKIEQLRVEKSLRQNDLYDHLIVHRLNKVYAQQENSKKTWFNRKHRNGLTAINNLTFGVPKGECFGLLGANGAGKTTTFKCLTTDLDQTLGQVYAINSKKEKINSTLNKKSYWKHIGYCPQFDALYEELTPDEHIRLFSRLKGVKRKNEDMLVNDLLQRFRLLDFTYKPVGCLSLGNRRKLSTALALVGNPSILLLDEPSSGVDPCSRRHLMSEILNITHVRKQSVVLTSHSMEECEALCTRISIMVDGHFKCLGSVQHLKNRFGNGYTLTLKIKDSCKTPLKFIQIIHEQLLEHIDDECTLKERSFNNVYQFDIPVHGILDLGSVYRLIELNKLRFNIIDYSLSQNTLDNIFINFIKQHTYTDAQKSPSMIRTKVDK